MIERWDDPPYRPIVPLLEPLGHEIAFELGRFSPKQREWLLRRDNYHCQFPGCSVDASKSGGKGLHGHHIIAAGFYKMWYAGKSDDIHELTENFPENGVILCGMGPLAHHNGPNGIHPDYYQALMNYRKGNKNSFKEISHEHWLKESSKVIYWNSKWDSILWQIAGERTEEYLKTHPQDPYPYDKVTQK